MLICVHLLCSSDNRCIFIYCYFLNTVTHFFSSLRAGLPTQVSPAGMFFVTTEPIPTVAPSPIVHHSRTTTFEKMFVFLPTVTLPANIAEPVIHTFSCR